MTMLPPLQSPSLRLLKPASENTRIYSWPSNDVSQAVKSNLYLYAKDTSLFSQCKDITEIEKQLNEDFESIYDWFVNNKLSIYFGNDKTKSMLLVNKFKIKKIRKLNMKDGDIQIKQYSKVKYLGYMLDDKMFVETMALSVTNK